MDESLRPVEHAHEITVRYGESDQMGVAYYANYLDWFEVARTEWLRARGRRYRDIEAEGVLLPVTEAYCRYTASARYDDRLRLVTWISRLTRATVQFDYRIERVSDGRQVATGHTVHAFLDREGRPRRVSPDLRAVLSGAGRDATPRTA